MAAILQVGIVGASAERGWAKDSHVPAIQQLAGLQLGAVVAGSQDKSNAAAKAFGARAGYATAKELFQDDAIDIVTVAVKVPDHRELVLGALNAKKHVYCEWPLGRNLQETQELGAAARAAGVHIAIGLQARANPVVRRAQEMLASGAIGRVLSARILSTTAAFGPKVEDAMAFGENADNGVTLLTIQGAHTLDVAVAVLGEYADLNALATTQYPKVVVGKDAKHQKRTTPDHLLTQSRLGSGAVLSLEVAGGRPADNTPFHLEVTGEAGTLTLVGGAMRGFQSGLFELLVNGKREQVDLGELASMPEAALNVAGIYRALRDDILSGTHTVPDAEHATRLARLLEDVVSSSETGMRKPAKDWPR